MNKINFRFSLLKVRFPDLYQEAESKIAGGVDRKDIVADWLNELICRRNMPDFTPSKKLSKSTTTETTDIDLAKNIMEDLLE